MYRNMYGDPYITAVNINLQNQEPKNFSEGGGQLLTVSRVHTQYNRVHKVPISLIYDMWVVGSKQVTNNDGKIDPQKIKYVHLYKRCSIWYSSY